MLKKGCEYIYQGDIVLTEEQVEMLDQPVTKSGFLTNWSKKWTDQTVYYTIDPGFNKTAELSKAITHFNARTNLQFWPRSSQPNYIHFVTIAGDVNYSYIGKTGGKQEIQISETGYLGNIIHEIGHALGLFHEHSRPDRDNYIRVLYENIKPQFHYAYDIEPSAGVSKIYYCCPVKLLL